MTLDILNSPKIMTYFLKASKHDLADYTKTTKSRIKIQLKIVEPSKRCQNVQINELQLLQFWFTIFVIEWFCCCKRPEKPEKYKIYL